jgi:methyltransferase (TIGR00027 family)
MRDRPSRTARHVAQRRSRLDRPAGPDGDPGADQRLEASLGGPRRLGRVRVPRAAGVPMAARTAFYDGMVQSSLADGIDQVVVLGAGYDGRALRFAAPGVRFFEVDHPATQADKARRLAEVGADLSGVHLVPADLAREDLGAVLAAAGFGADRPALFLCEGLLPYLTGAQGERLLQAAHDTSAPGSRFAVDFSVRPASIPWLARAIRGGVDVVLRAAGEPRRSEFGPGDPEALLARTGWTVRPDPDRKLVHGFGLQLVGER